MSELSEGSLYKKRKKSRDERRKRKRRYPDDISRREVREIERATRNILRRLGYEMTEDGLKFGRARELYYEVELRGKKKGNQDQIALGLKSNPPKAVFDIIYSDPDKMVSEIYSLIQDTIEKHDLDLSVHRV